MKVREKPQQKQSLRVAFAQVPALLRVCGSWAFASAFFLFALLFSPLALALSPSGKDPHSCVQEPLALMPVLKGLIEPNSSEIKLKKDALQQLCRSNHRALNNLKPIEEAMSGDSFEESLLVRMGDDKQHALRLKKKRAGDKFGACENAYLSLVRALDKVVEIKKEICSNQIKIQKELEACNGNIQVCEKKYTSIIELGTSQKTKFEEAKQSILPYIRHHGEYLESATKLYQKDFDAIQANRIKPTTQLTPRTAELVDGSGVTTVKAANGNKRSIPEYAAALEGGREAESVSSWITSQPEWDQVRSISPGPIFAELKVAEIKIAKFEIYLNKYIDEKITSTTRELQFYANELEKRKTNAGSAGSNIGKYAPLAAPAATALTSMSKTATPAASALAKTTSAIAPLAPAAIGAAAVSSLAGRSSASSGGGSMYPSQPIFDMGGSGKAQPAGPTTNSFGEKTTPSGGAAPSPITKESFGVGDALNPKTEPKAANPTPLTLAGNGSAGSGSSSFQKIIRPGNAQNPPAPVTASSGGASPNDDMLSSFGGDLNKPKSGSSKSSSDGNDVAKLLGDMKSLFNFDEGLGGGFNMDPTGGHHGGSSGSTAPSEGGMAEVGGEEYSPEGEYAAEGAAEEMQDGEYASGGRESASLGSRRDLDNTSLFHRVRNRLRICQEKGAVFSGLGGGI